MATGLEQQLWAAADILRGKMDASEYKNYLLGLVFYKYLSDSELREVYEQENGQTTDFPTRSIQYQTLMDWFEDDSEELAEIIQLQKGYFIKPSQLFYTYRQPADRYDLNSTKLGSNAQQRNVTITEVLRALDEIDLFEHDGDVIGDAY
ncbi:restriction endonuclease subunit M, partial [Leuconostoc mesenteroides subsp. mesenteroides]|uniref:type I restriction-modification system subunit M N-terminal domain-containing protein n=1 Tax=Leuconostoc mesenteroides TaxID=1245 RepID=UPI000A0DC328